MQLAAPFCLLYKHLAATFFNKSKGMLSSLKNRWKVGTKELTLILCVFAITGFTTAYLSRSAPVWVGFDGDTHWLPKLLLRVGVLIFGYQVVLLLVAFLLGQFSFFWKFEKKILQRLGLIKMEKPTSSK